MTTTFCYYLIEMTRRSQGIGPNVPEGIGFLELALPASRPDDGFARYGLYRLRATAAEHVDPDVAQPVPPPLAALLDAAHDYPPALALMRNDVGQYETDFPPTFLALVTQRLQAHLDRRLSTPYLLAQVRQSTDIYKAPGESCWIVNYRPAQGTRGATVSWVSSDFFIYQDPASHFAIDETELTRRFPPRTLPLARRPRDQPR